MADKAEPKTENSGELILALQNRINSLEAKLQEAEKSQSGKSWVELSLLDSKVAELRAEISELRAQKKEALKVEPLKEEPKKEDVKTDAKGTQANAYIEGASHVSLY